MYMWGGGIIDYPPDTPVSIALYRRGMCRGETSIVGGRTGWSHMPGEPIPMQFRSLLSQEQYTAILSDIVDNYGGYWTRQNLYFVPCCLAGFFTGGIGWILALFGLCLGAHHDHLYWERGVLKVNEKYNYIFGPLNMRLSLEPKTELRARGGPWIEWSVGNSGGLAYDMPNFMLMGGGNMLMGGGMGLGGAEGGGMMMMGPMGGGPGQNIYPGGNMMPMGGNMGGNSRVMVIDARTGTHPGGSYPGPGGSYPGPGGSYPGPGGSYPGGPPGQFQGGGLQGGGLGYHPAGNDPTMAVVGNPVGSNVAMGGPVSDRRPPRGSCGGNGNPNASNPGINPNATTNVQVQAHNSVQTINTINSANIVPTSSYPVPGRTSEYERVD